MLCAPVSNVDNNAVDWLVLPTLTCMLEHVVVAYLYISLRIQFSLHFKRFWNMRLAVGVFLMITS